MKKHITIPEAVSALKVSRQTVENRVRKGDYISEKIPSPNQAGKMITLVAVESLPPQVRRSLIDSAATQNTSQINPPQTHNESAIESISPEEALAWYQKQSQTHRNRIDQRREKLEAINCEIAQVECKNKTEALKTICKNHGWSPGTYYRFQKGWTHQNLKGLTDKRFGNSRTKLTPDQQGFIISLIKQNPTRRPGPIWEYVQQQFPEYPVNGMTIRRFMEGWKKKNHELYQFLLDPDQWKSKYMISFGSESQKAHHFGHYWELDSTIADLMCADGKRYALIGCIDVFSRKVKIHVGPTSNSHGIACVMRSAIIEWGLPENIVRDNGKDYDSNHVNGICSALGITPHNAPPFSPEKKPHIERFFRTLSTSLFEELRGYIGHSVAERKAIEARNSFAQRFMKGGDPIPVDLSPNQLQNIINRWIETVYHQRVHGGIGCPPEVKAVQGAEPARMVEDPRALDLLLQPAGESTVSKKGIRYRSAHYFSPELMGYVGDRVQVRIDQESAGTLYAFDLEGRYLFTAYDDSLSELTAGDYSNLRKSQRKVVTQKKRAIEVLEQDPMISLLDARQVENKITAITRHSKASLESLDEAGNALLEQNGRKPQRYKSIAQQIAEADGRKWNDDDDLDYMENLEIVNR